MKEARLSNHTLIIHFVLSLSLISLALSVLVNSIVRALHSWSLYKGVCPNNTIYPNTQGQANERQNTKCRMSVWLVSRASFNYNNGMKCFELLTKAVQINPERHYSTNYSNSTIDSSHKIELRELTDYFLNLGWQRI